MSDIFKEIDQELQHDRLRTLWDRYGAWLILFAVLLVVGVAGFQLWNYLMIRDQEQETAALIAAAGPIDDGNYAAAITALEELRSDTGGTMAALIRLREAEARLGIDDVAGAIAMLDAVAADASVDRMIRDLALLYSVSLQIDKASFDEVNARLSPLAQPNAAWRFSARELIGLAAMKASRTSEARDRFRMIAEDPQAPAGFQRRAVQMLTLLGGDEDQSPVQPEEPS